jgi:hypothetical protein
MATVSALVYRLAHRTVGLRAWVETHSFGLALLLAFAALAASPSSGPMRDDPFPIRW